MSAALTTTPDVQPQPACGRSDVVPRRGELGVVTYSRGTLGDHHATVCDWLRENRTESRMIGYVNPHVYNLAKKNPTLREFLARADLVAVDGLGMAAAALLVNRHSQTRTVMTALFDRVLATEDLPAHCAVLIGGNEEMMAKGAAAINRASRRIEVIALRDGYQPMADYISFLREQRAADVVLIAMGTPRSEELALAAAGLFPGKLLWSIGGGTLHLYAGTKRRAPSIVSTLGLEWLWRIVSEPRIAPRYLIGVPVFIAAMLRLLFSKRNHGPSA